jgi:1-acyl-sn-glycerol-3-phosphate acyltransferase
MLSDFKPPRPNASIIALTRWLYPIHLNHSAKLSVGFTRESLASLKKYDRERTVFVFNHPDRLDPLILGTLDKHLGQPASCVVAREVFDWDMGLRGLLFQSLGCYSVNRGAADLKSIRMTKNLLHSQCAKLIVFPEGKITCDSSHIHDLQRSFMHILLESQIELLRQTTSDSILIVPVATRYELETDLESSFPRTLQAIEHKLQVERVPNTSVIDRIQVALDRLLSDLTNVYHLNVPEELAAIEKIDRLANHICHKIGSYFDVQPEGCNARDCHLYFIRSIVSRAIDERHGSPYQNSIAKKLHQTYKQFLVDLDRVERLLICHANLEREKTAIQACRTADFMEFELFGRMTPKGKQRAVVNFGEPLQVGSYLPLYANSKRDAVEKLSDDTRRNLQAALDGTILTDRSLRQQMPGQFKNNAIHSKG